MLQLNDHRVSILKLKAVLTFLLQNIKVFELLTYDFGHRHKLLHAVLNGHL